MVLCVCECAFTTVVVESDIILKIWLALLIMLVIGGSKVSTKLPVIQGLLNQVDALILTGGLAFAFVCAQRISIGSSLVKDTMVETDKEILLTAQAKNEIILGYHLLMPVASDLSFMLQ